MSMLGNPVSGNHTVEPTTTPLPVEGRGSSSTPSAPGIGGTSSAMATAADSTAPTTAAPSTPSGSKVRPSIFAKKDALLETFKGFFTSPDATVLKHPVTSLISNVAIKALFYLVAQTFPVIGWAVIAFSAGLFERVIVLNPREYLRGIIHVAQSTWQILLSKVTSKPTTPASTTPTAPASTTPTAPTTPSSSAASS